MPRLYFRGLCAEHAACFQSAFQLLIPGAYATQALVKASPAVPAQWREGSAATAPVPAAASDNTTAFSWAKKQMPDMPLSLLGKYFRLRQVRVLQGDQVKRVPRTRNLVPGDILLLPKDLPEATTGSSRTAAAAAQAAVIDSASSWEDQGPESLQQQRQRNAWQQMRQVQQQDAAVAQSDLLQQQTQQWQQQQERLQETEEVIELDQCWLQQQVNTSADVTQLHRHKQHSQKSLVEWPAKQIAKHPPQQQQGLTVQQIRRWMLASSQDIAIIYKPPGVSFMAPSSSSTSSGTRVSAAAGKQLHPVVREALGIDPPDAPKLLAGLDVRESGAVVLSRTAAAHQWLSAWIAGEPAAVAAAAAALDTDKDGSSSSGSNRGRQRQKKLKRLVAAAAAVEDSGSSSHGVPVCTAREVAGLQQLMMAVGGLRLRRVFWAVVQGRLPVRQTGTLRNRMLRGELALPSLTRYKVLASTEGLSWLELQPLTNRRNQIRVHCGKTLGMPIVGDYRYGYRPWAASSAVEPRLASYQSKFAAGRSTQGAAGAADTELDARETSSGQHNYVHGTRQDPDEPHMLHCREVVLLRPRKPPVRVVAPLPRAMKQLLQTMGWA